MRTSEDTWYRAGGIAFAAMACMSFAAHAQQVSKKTLSKTQIRAACGNEIHAMRQEDTANFEEYVARANLRPDGPEKAASQKMYSRMRTEIYSPKDDVDWIVKGWGQWTFDPEDLERLRLKVARLNAENLTGRGAHQVQLCIATAMLALQEGRPISASAVPPADDAKVLGGVYRP